jgi:hypothetical protein
MTLGPNGGRVVLRVGSDMEDRNRVTADDGDMQSHHSSHRRPRRGARGGLLLRGHCGAVSTTRLMCQQKRH